MQVKKWRMSKKLLGLTKLGRVKFGKKGVKVALAKTVKDKGTPEVIVVDIPVEKVRMSPVFRSKEQEELFAKCANKSMSTTALLKW